jgi:hypothetical protein
MVFEIQYSEYYPSLLSTEKARQTEQNICFYCSLYVHQFLFNLFLRKNTFLLESGKIESSHGCTG